MRLERKAEFEAALARLRRRDPEKLAAFVLSLAHDSGPVGQQVRTFIVGDDVLDVEESLRQRLRSLQSPSDYNHRHAPLSPDRAIATHPPVHSNLDCAGGPRAPSGSSL